MELEKHFGLGSPFRHFFLNLAFVDALLIERILEGQLQIFEKLSNVEASAFLTLSTHWWNQMC